MNKRWWESKPVALANGRWMPQVNLFEQDDEGLAIRTLVFDGKLTFGNEGDAAAHGTAVAVRWLTEKVEPLRSQKSG